MKYFIKDSDQEVKFGQVIEVEQKIATSLGEGICKTKVEVTPENIELLVKKGFLVQKNDEKEASDLEAYWHRLKPYIRRFARKNDMPLTAAMLYFASVNELSPIAHIEILLEVIAEVKNRGKEGEQRYFCDPMRKFRVTEYKSNNPMLPGFIDIADAKEAYELIKPFVDEINGQ